MLETSEYDTRSSNVSGKFNAIDRINAQKLTSNNTVS